MIQVGLTVFIGLFILSQMYEYLRQFTLPFPVYLLLGMLLAIASNFNYSIYLKGHQTTIVEDVTPPPSSLPKSIKDEANV